MGSRQAYRANLRRLRSWDAFLRKNSGLPGRRGNLELAQAVADEGSPELFEGYLRFGPMEAPANSQDEFLLFCGILGHGRLLSEGRLEVLPLLRSFASDPRWRAREAVAMALQRFGDADIRALVTEMRRWSRGAPFEQRAAAAALCEPRLLQEPRHALATLKILDAITASVECSRERRSDAWLALRKGLGYCWSVAVAALPAEGLPLMERWLRSEDKDIRWIMKENLGKKRLTMAAPDWVRRWSRRLSGSTRAVAGTEAA